MTTVTMSASVSPLVQGFLLYASIIIAFGPQNMFVLRQGLRRQHVFATALISTLADVVLIALAVGGLSAVISASGIFQTAVTVVGALFLMWCGVRSLLNAVRSGASATHTSVQCATIGAQGAVVAALSFSFLNPSAYVDTLVIVGSKSLLFPVDQRLVFGVGALVASAFWFFALAYGASRLSPIFRTQAAWRALDITSGFIMIGIAGTMLAAAHIIPMI